MKASNIAKGGIYTALSLIAIYISSIIPTNRLLLLGIASCIIPFSIITTNIKNTVIVYAAVSLLSFLIVPSKGITVSYIILFGSYGFVKYYIEKLRNTPLEIALKIIFFNISSFALFFLYKTLFAETIKIQLPIYLIILLLQVAFIIYDYTITVFINYSNSKLINKFK